MLQDWQLGDISNCIYAPPCATIGQVEAGRMSWNMDLRRWCTRRPLIARNCAAT